MLGTSDFAVPIVDSETVGAAGFDTVAAAGIDSGTLDLVDSGTVPGCCYLFSGTYNCYLPYDYGRLQKSGVLVQDCCNCDLHDHKIHEFNNISFLDIYHNLLHFLHFFLLGFDFDYFPGKKCYKNFADYSSESACFEWFD